MATIAADADLVPAQLRVKVVCRPRYGCRDCEGAVVQAPAPERPIDGGMAATKRWWRTLRQAQMLKRQGITLDRSTLEGLGAAPCWWLTPLYELVLGTVLSSDKVFADETTLPVLDPGRGKTKPGSSSSLTFIAARSFRRSARHILFIELWSVQPARQRELQQAFESINRHSTLRCPSSPHYCRCHHARLGGAWRPSDQGYSARTDDHAYLIMMSTTLAHKKSHVTPLAPAPQRHHRIPFSSVALWHGEYDGWMGRPLWLPHPPPTANKLPV